MKAISIFIISWTLLTIQCVAQTDARLSLFQFNQEFFNPAFSGGSAIAKATILNRTAFTNIEGGPQTNGIAVHSPLSFNSGAGVNATLDNIGNTTITTVSGDFSYHIPLNNPSLYILSFGVRFGYSNESFNPTGDQLLDPSFFSQTRNSLFGGVGGVLSGENFHVALSAPSLAVINDQLSPSGAIISGAFREDLQPNFSLHFSALVRILFNSPQEYEGTVSFQFYDQVFAGLGYIHDRGPGFFLGMRFKKGFELNYAYDTNLFNNLFNTGASHELQLTYKYSFRRLLVRESRSWLGGRWKDYYFHPKHR